MKYGARNDVVGRVKSIQRGDVMSLIKFEVRSPGRMASVITTESVDELDLKVGDTVHLVVKAIHVLPVKDVQPARATVRSAPRRARRPRG
jgi:molybdate transport system regulatory protein